MALFTEEEIKEANSKVNKDPELIESEVIAQSPDQKALTIDFKSDGLVKFENQLELSNAARFLVKIKLAPDHLVKLGPEAVATALIFCQQYNLPYSAMNEIGVVKGKAGAFGSLVTALAQRDPEYGEMVVQYTNSSGEFINSKNKNLDDDVNACVIQIQKKGSQVCKEYFFTKKEAQTAGLMGNNTYQKYLKDMLFHRAKFRAMKTEYARALNGVESYEIMKSDSEIRDVSALDKLNEKLGLSNAD